VRRADQETRAPRGPMSDITRQILAEAAAGAVEGDWRDYAAAYASGAFDPPS
jgi:hypothetical protein